MLSMKLELHCQSDGHSSSGRPRHEGLWALTSEGQETQLDQAQALAISKYIRARLKPSEDDDEPAPEAVTASALFDDPTRKFWFVGAAWGDDDQLERFLTEGIWQNRRSR
jgi:5-methylcytosine-specific restriction enzyme B